MPIKPLGNNVAQQIAHYEQLAQQPQVGQRANVAGGVQMRPGIANAQQLRNPQQVQRMNFGAQLKAAIVRVGRSAVETITGRFAEMKAARQARAQLAATNRALKTATDNAVEGFKGPNSMVRLTIPGTSQNIEWPGKMFADMIDNTPKSQRLDAIENFEGRMQSRLENGAAIYATLTANPPGNVVPPDVQNVADFTLFMYAKATAQGDFFVNGSFSIADPNGNIATWMDGSREVYPRDSSHLGALQKETITESNGRQHENVQRGIDIPKTIETGLPANLKTVCYGTITPLPGSNGARRLFLKAESFGCRFNTLKSEARAQAGVAARPSRGMTDVASMIGHGSSFIITRFQKSIGGSRKEHCPEPIKDLLSKWSGNRWYHKLTGNVFNKIQLPPATSTAGQLFAKILDSKSEKGGIGLRQLSSRIAEVENDLRGPMGLQIPANELSQLVEFLTEAKLAIAELPNNDRLDVRLGNEVLID